MTALEFKAEMDRLVGQFGRAVYSEARMHLIFRQVAHLPASWWKRAVDKFLLEARQAPLLPEISAEIAREREREWTRLKHEEPEALAGACTFGPEEQAELLRAIRLRAAGALNDEAWGNVRSLINNALRRPSACVHCDGTGVFTAVVTAGEQRGNQYAFRCECALGERDHRKAFRRWEFAFSSTLAR